MWRKTNASCPTGNTITQSDGSNEPEAWLADWASGLAGCASGLAGWVSGLAGWASGLAGWPSGGNGQMDGWTDKQKISPFYMTLSPIGAAAPLQPNFNPKTV